MNYFFTGPNLFFSAFMHDLRSWTIDYYGYYKPENAYDKSRIDLRNYYSLYYYFCDYDLIYEIKNDKYELCRFNQIMDGLSKFYTALINAPKNYQFKTERKYFLSLTELYKPLGLKYNEFK